MSQLILYGRGLIAEEYCRYLEGLGRGREVAAFAVTSMKGQGETYCGRPCMEIREAMAKFPEAEVHLALQEKYHDEVIALLKGLGRSPREVIGLHRMTELLGEQGIREISAVCPELTVKRNPYDYSMLEITDSEHGDKRFTFYPMTQVPLSEEDIEHIRAYFREENLYIAMATSAKDAKVSRENLPNYVHPALGGAASYRGLRSEDMEYDDEVCTVTGNGQQSPPLEGRGTAVGGGGVSAAALCEPNLSRYNHLYSELTVAYWLSQKAPQAKYLGLCHYRRHFVLTEELSAKLEAGTVDVLLTTPRLTFPTVHAYFAGLPVTTMDELDYETMLSLIENEDSELAKFSREYLERQIHFPNNMLIAKREIYLAYCQFIFAVLQGMQAKYEAEGIKRPDRYLGYVGELLTTVYFAYHMGKWRTEYIDYQLLKEI